MFFSIYCYLKIKSRFSLLLFVKQVNKRELNLALILKSKIGKLYLKTAERPSKNKDGRPKLIRTHLVEPELPPLT